MSMQPSIARDLREAHKARGFRYHLIAFVLVIALLVAINVSTGGPYWVLWVAVGWGIGVLAHGFFAYRSRILPRTMPSPR